MFIHKACLPHGFLPLHSLMSANDGRSGRSAIGWRGGLASGGRRVVDFFPIERSFTRMLIVGLEVKAPKKRRVEGRKRTRWWKLKED